MLEAGKLKEAAEVFSIAIEEYRKNGPDEIRLVQMYRTMGYCLENMGHRKQALETYYSALSILKEGDIRGIFSERFTTPWAGCVCMSVGMR